jgi:hypothetical protein
MSGGNEKTSFEERYREFAFGMKGTPISLFNSPIPFPFWCLCFLEVTNHRKVHRGEEPIIDDSVIFPTIRCISNVVVSLRFKLRTVTTVFEIVELKGILFKNAANPIRLNPQEFAKNKVKTSSGKTNERNRSIRIVGCKN